MTHAAELLHVTQPTLSRAIHALEEELGKKLFTRRSFSIALTEEGMLLRSRAEDLVTMADKIEREFLTMDDLTGGGTVSGSGGVLSDPVSGPGDPRSQGQLPGAPLPHHQRRHRAGHREAGPGAAGLRRGVRDPGRAEI